jgi:F-type H+-transporting ATPase subunit delta|tara:strand:+ start:4834 stop:5391 length:558 start_codon:yes stop_codon:yes gene_type:complete
MSANKSFSSETSERYARALFELSKESNELEKTEKNISNFKLLYYGSDEIKNFVKDPSKSIIQQNEVVNFIGEKLEFSKNLKSFFLLLVKKRRIFFINKILESFLKLCAKNRGELKASLISSRELSKSELDRISKDLSDTMGSTLKFDYKVDKDLIGGLKLQLGSFMIDTSIKNKLKKYEQMMIEN